MEEHKRKNKDMITNVFGSTLQASDDRVLFFFYMKGVSNVSTYKSVNFNTIGKSSE